MRSRMILVLFFCFLLISCSTPSPDDSVFAVPDEEKLVVQCLTLSPGADETQIILSWHSEDEHGIVNIRENASDMETEYKAQSRFVDEVFGFSHKATVGGLTPNTAYNYRVSNGKLETPEYELTIGDKNKFSFFVFGDPQITDPVNDGAAWADTLKTAMSAFPAASFMISCGDQSDSIGGEEHYATYLAPPELKSLPAAQTMGNHDAYLEPLLSNHFNMPNAGLRRTLFEAVSLPQDYWFKYGNALFMVLDSNVTDITHHRPFMERVVNANSDSVWKIVVFHDSIYSEGAHNNSLMQMLQRETWTPVFENLGINVVFSAHDHSYSRTHPLRDGEVSRQGIVYFSLNSSTGSKYYDFSQSKQAPYTAYRSQNYRPQFTRVDATDGSLTVTTYEVLENGEIAEIDSYTFSKR